MPVHYSVLASGYAVGKTLLLFNQLHPAVPGTPGAPVPLRAAEVDKHIDKITKDNLYSRIFLMQPERRELLKTIVAKCKDTTEIVAAQCEIAVPAWRDVRIAIAEKEHSKKVEEELRRNREKDSKMRFDSNWHDFQPKDGK